MLDIFYYLGVATPATLSAVGAGIGQGLIGKKAEESLLTQPDSSGDISKISIIGIALTETVSILGFITSIILMFSERSTAEFAPLGILGIAIAIGISGLVVGITSSFSAQTACKSVARQPFMKGKIMNLMLLTQALGMTPMIFAFLIFILIKPQLASATTFAIGVQFLATGIAIGIGSIGPSIGLGLLGKAACRAVGFNRHSFKKIMQFTFISEALIETPLLFALIISLTILQLDMANVSLQKTLTILFAACCMGFSTIGNGIGSGKTSSSACKQIARNVEKYPSISKITFVAISMIDTFPIYGLIVSLMMILAAK